MKTYLVTGGAGFIGSNYIRFLLGHNNDVRILNLDKLTYAGNLGNLSDIEADPRYQFIHGDICDIALLQTIFENGPIDYVVNFAAESHVDRSIEDPGVFIQTNIGGTVTLLNAAMRAWRTGEDTYRCGVKFLQVSTDEVYGSLGPNGLFTETSPLDPHSPYAASKVGADMQVKAFFDTYQLPVNITRCSNNYGPFQFPEKLIPLMIHNAREQKPLPVYGDGMQVRDWLYVTDHCNAIELVLWNAVPGEIYNIGGNNEQYNINIVKAIIRYLQARGFPIDNSLIHHVTDRKGHDRRYAIDASKIKRELGWMPQISFEQGIEQTLEWYISHNEWLDNVTSGTYTQYYERIYGGRQAWK